MGCRVLKRGPSDQKFKRSYEFFSKIGGVYVNKNTLQNRKKILALFHNSDTL